MYFYLSNKRQGWAKIKHIEPCKSFLLSFTFPESKEWLKTKELVVDNRAEIQKFRKSKLTILLSIKLICMWITSIVLFYGLTLNSVSLSGDLTTNMMILGSMDIASCTSLVFISPRVARKKLVAITYALGGILLLTSYGLNFETKTDANCF